MEKINVGIPSKEYPIYFEEKFEQLPGYMHNHGCKEKILIVTDENVDVHYGEYVLGLLKSNGFEAYKYVIPAGENSKSFDVAQKIFDVCIEKELTRKSTFIALGGGVVGDLTGFAAATYMRGVSFIQCPTTILSQSDSSVGGKVGINYQHHKNIIGAFHQPLFVYMALDTLKTLPKRQISAGFAEVIKHGCIYDKEFLTFLNQNAKQILDLETDLMYKTIRRNCEIKADVVSKDEKEQGIRALLNFGHTFGHSVESLKNFELLHGECVAIGMAMALELSYIMENISEEEKTQILDLMRIYGLSITVDGLSIDTIYSHMFHDKKAEKNSLRIVVLEGLGKAQIIKDPSQEHVHSAIASMLGK